MANFISTEGQQWAELIPKLSRINLLVAIVALVYVCGTAIALDFLPCLIR